MRTKPGVARTWKIRVEIDRPYVEKTGHMYYKESHIMQSTEIYKKEGNPKNE